MLMLDDFVYSMPMADKRELARSERNALAIDQLRLEQRVGGLKALECHIIRADIKAIGLLEETLCWIEHRDGKHLARYEGIEWAKYLSEWRIVVCYALASGGIGKHRYEYAVDILRDIEPVAPMSKADIRKAVARAKRALRAPA